MGTERKEVGRHRPHRDCRKWGRGMIFPRGLSQPDPIEEGLRGKKYQQLQTKVSLAGEKSLLPSEGTELKMRFAFFSWVKKASSVAFPLSLFHHILRSQKKKQPSVRDAALPQVFDTPPPRVPSPPPRPYVPCRPAPCLPLPAGSAVL